jgi:hypothetical protein
MVQNGQGAKTKDEKFCGYMSREKELRKAIADIMAKLNRSNLSAEDGKQHAKSLVVAYMHLDVLEEDFKMEIKTELEKEFKEGLPPVSPPAAQVAAASQGVQPGV